MIVILRNSHLCIPQKNTPAMKSPISLNHGSFRTRFTRVPAWIASTAMICLPVPALAAGLEITGTGSYSQNFDTLPPSGTANPWADDSTLAGWYASKNAINAGTGSSDNAALYSFGPAAGSERALGSLASGGTGIIYYGVLFHNTAGSPVVIDTIAYTGEQWRKSGVETVQTLELSYRQDSVPITSTSTGTWTAVPSGNFNSPVYTANAGALDGNAAPNRTNISINPLIGVAPGSYLMIRWKDSDDTGLDHGLAIDDLSVSWTLNAPLPPGAIAFTGFNADGNDDLAFVALAPIAQGTVIHFTDKAWNGSAIGAGGAFGSGEGIITWTAPAGGVAQGAVVTLNNLSSAGRTASVGAIAASGSFDLGGDNETVYAFQGGTTAATGFLAVVATHTGDPVTNTGLASEHIVYLPADEDIAAYTGPRAGQASYAAYLSLIGNVANWISQDATGDQSNDTIVPDLPFDPTAFTLTGSGNTFAAWISGFDFSAYPGADLSAGGDADQDGVPNVVENILGSNPAGSSPGLTNVAASGGSLVFRHTRNATPASDLSAGYQWSADLANWQNSGAESGGITVTCGVPVVITPGDPDLVEVTAAISGAPAKVFVRLRAVQN